VDLLIATANQGKAREFREMLGDARFAWRDLSSMQNVQPVEETGQTFLANACLKASAYAQQFHTWALADDSGLEVDALEGRPGVTSARWAAMHSAGEGDEANKALLLRQMKDVSEDRRGARFRCALALADASGKIIITAQDRIEGNILRAARGSGGFGYDPLFWVVELGRGMAELTPAEKHGISHRGRALRRLRALLDRTPL
jgi:XTP/dITP diphosphohydrolase